MYLSELLDSGFVDYFGGRRCVVDAEALKMEDA